MIMLLAAAIGQRNKERFRSYKIQVKGGPHGAFLSHENIEDLLQQHTAGVRGELMSAFNLRAVETKFQLHPMIRSAQLYFDNQDVLHVQIQEKIPQARVFTINGRSFYLDEVGRPMPLAENKTLKLPVFTGLPDSIGIGNRDSVLLAKMRLTAQQIIADSFWSSQAAQLDRGITGEWEMTPTVGDHVIKMGDLVDVQEKLQRIAIFYKQVLTKVGLSRYRVIDVRFEGQVVAGRGENPRVDSLQLRRSVQQLLKQSRTIENDTVIRYLPKPLQPLLPDAVDSLNELGTTLPSDSTQTGVNKK
jgi:cell division protein FtsQ